MSFDITGYHIDDVYNGRGPIPYDDPIAIMGRRDLLEYVADDIDAPAPHEVRDAIEFWLSLDDAKNLHFRLGEAIAWEEKRLESANLKARAKSAT